jgi:hypothetical protein
MLTSLFVAAALAAPCGTHGWTDATRVALPADQPVLIVTHPSTLWDGRFSSKVGMDAAVAYAKKRSYPVIYLEDNADEQTYFFSDCSPTYWVDSSGGEFAFRVPSNHVYSVGGHWELCQANTQSDLMTAWSSKRDVPLTFTQVLDGLYAYGQYVRSDDPYANDFNRFMDIVSFRKPGYDWPKRKHNMLEMMGVIQNDAREVEYLKRGLPPFTQIHASYKIELWYNGRMIETLRQGRPTNPPVLKMEFIDSLYEDGYAPARR